MSKQDTLRTLLEPAVVGLGYELVGIEFLSRGKFSSLLRIYIDHPDGVGVDDCEAVSRQVSAILDVEDTVQGRYSLEISSPGLDRPLFSLAHFERFVGRDIAFRMQSPINGRRNFTGTLRGVENGNILLEVSGEVLVLSWDLIEKANLVPDIQF